MLPFFSVLPQPRAVVPVTSQSARGVAPWAPWRSAIAIAPKRLGTQHPRPTLLCSYGSTIAALEAAVSSSEAGDRLLLRSYVFEEGVSGRTLLRSLRSAARRGVHLRLGIDRSPLSSLTRAVEGSSTLSDELVLLAQEWPQTVTLEPGTQPDHSKVLLLRKADPSLCVAVLGGVNIGDRFEEWRDFSVRLNGSYDVGALASALKLPSSFTPSSESPQPGVAQRLLSRTSALSFAVNTPGAFCPLRFAGRMPLLAHAGVNTSLRAFFDDPGLIRYTVASAYIDHTGGELLLRALSRGAHVRLVAPRTPNVYAHANRAALGRLMRRAGETGGQLSVRMHPAMVHAKAASAARADGSVCAYLGSANLKERSLTQFGELLMRAEGEVAAELQQALGSLYEEAEEVTQKMLRHDPTRAAVETWLG